VTGPGAARPAVVEDEELAGLAGERTDLAWTRSGLAVVGAVAALVKRAVDDLDLTSASSIVAALLVALAVAWGASVVYGAVFARPTRDPRRPVDDQRARRVAYGTALVGGGALVIALLPG
jgi:uncharacterized membrane protein YidH (DUF202 family)